MQEPSKGYNLLVSLEDFEMSYHDVGESSIPIIFLHGFPFDKSMWQGQLDFLKSSYRVISIDIRGFGQSTDEDSALNIQLFADDLVAFLEKLSIAKAIICGLSMGGFIALNAVKRFPERFEALILCDTQCIADTTVDKEKRYTTIENIEVNGASDFNEEFLKSVFHKESLLHKTALVDQLRKVVFSNSKNIIAKGLEALAERSETCSILNKINLPTLIICGREDEVTPLHESQFMHKNIDDSNLYVIDKAGHVSNLEQPEEFNNQLLIFLSSIKDFNYDKINGDKRLA
jgi:3-oxoadipate enol-lactonase